MTAKRQLSAIKVESHLLKTTFKHIHDDGFYNSSRKDANKISTQISPSNFSKETISSQKVSKQDPSTPKSHTKTSEIKCFKCLSFGHIAANCPHKKTIMFNAVNQALITTKDKNTNEKQEESHVGLTLLTPTQITKPLRYTFFLSFSFPNNSKYLTSLLRKFRDVFNIPPKSFPLLRGFSQQNHFFLKHPLQSWHVSRTIPYELPKLHAHKFVAHPNLRNIFSVYKLTMLFAGVLNSRSNSLQLGGHDVSQKYMKMTKDAILEGHLNKQVKTSSIEEMDKAQSIGSSSY